MNKLKENLIIIAVVFFIIPMVCLGIMYTISKILPSDDSPAFSDGIQCYRDAMGRICE